MSTTYDIRRPKVATKAKLEFVWAMARHSSATVRQCEALMRYGATLWRLERDHSLPSIAKRDRIRRKVAELCREIECVAEFVPVFIIISGGEGITVPS